MYQSLDLTLPVAIEKIHDGRIQLPQFQRDFKWARADQISLLDSIQKNYPVGTLLLLEMNDRAGDESPFGKRVFFGAPAAVREAEYLVLDGQQRLSTVYNAFSAEASTWLSVDLRKLWAATSGQAGIPIDLQSLITPRRRPAQHPDAMLFTRDLLPLPFVRDRAAMRQRLSQYRQNLLGNPETASFGEFVDLHLEGYFDVFFEYQFPAVVLPGDLDIEAVANVFTKINTQGLRLSAFDLCVAALFPSGVYLRTMWEDASEDADVGAVDSDGTNLLQAVALQAAKPPKKAALVRNLKKVDLDAYWHKSVQAAKEAAAMLRAAGATGGKTIPYDALLPVLIATLAELPTAANVAAEAQRRRRIARWVMQSAFLNRYNEGTDVKQVADFPLVRTWLAGGEAPEFLTEVVAWQPAWDALGRTGARASAILALLNASKPRDLVQDTEQLGIDVDDAVRAELHHIFPRAYLRARGYDDKASEKALNITFLTRESNNFISDRAPSVYLRDRLAEFSADIPDDEALTKLRAVLRTHLINQDGYECLMADDYEGFLAARAQGVRDALSALGVPVALVLEAEENEGELVDGEFVDEGS